MPHPISSPSMELPLTAPSPHSVTAIGRDGRRTKYTIETRSLSYDIPSTAWSQWLCNGGPSSWSTTPTATILSDVSCEARPGEITAIVGPSGAGKTTLLSILAGMIHPDHVHGQILVNGRDMVPSRFRRVSGYVTQDDALFPLLTVRESLTYSCRLRLRTSRCDDTVANRVLELMKELGLDHVAESRVGGCSGRGISGGERRRVSIGVELVHDPAVLLLDEPTSGLDSASALQIMKLLQSMATLQGKTVVLTIHQPGFRILELFSRVVLISGGTVRHNGPLALLEQHLKGAGHSIPPHVNVLEYAMDATSSLPSQQHHHLSLASSSPSAAAKEDRAVYANSPAEEVLILGERSFKNILRTNQLFAAKMLQSASAGLGLGSVFMNVGDVQSRLGFFAFTLTFLLSSTTEGLPVFLQERGILMRETTRGAYRVSSYVVASALVFLPFLLAVGLLYAFPVYWMVGLRRELDGFLYFALVIWMVVMMANSFVSCFSALVPNYIMGNSLIAGVMGAFFLFSGYFIQKESIPRYWIFMHYLSLFKYPFEAFLVNQYGAGRGRVECLQKASGVCILDGATFLRQQGVDDSQKWSSLMVMLGFICGYRVLCFGILWYRCSRMRR